MNLTTRIRAIVLGLLVALCSCSSGAQLKIEAETPVARGGIDLRIPPDDEGSEMFLFPHPLMFGLCAIASTGDGQHGPPILLGPGVNLLTIPGGIGPPVVSYYPWQGSFEPDAFGGAAGTARHHLDLLPWVPRDDGENVTGYAEIDAASREEAESRFRELTKAYERMLLGLDPGALPAWLREAIFVSWHVVDSGPEAGDLVFTSAMPGARVEDYRFDWNGHEGYAVVGDGAITWSVGAWQLVAVVVAREDVNLPIDLTRPVRDDYGVRMATDLGASLRCGAAYEFRAPR